MMRFSESVAAAAVSIMAFGAAGAAGADERLSPQSVRATFIGTPWHSDSGAFLFRENGTYSYYDFAEQKQWGTWDYRMDQNGGLVAETTTYKFFRRNDGTFYYYHTRSDDYYNAYPDKSFP